MVFVPWQRGVVQCWLLPHKPYQFFINLSLQPHLLYDYNTSKIVAIQVMISRSLRAENMENRIYMRTLSVRLFFRTEIRTYGNTNIKQRLIRFCDADKSRTDKVRRINNSHTWKRSLKRTTHKIRRKKTDTMETEPYTSWKKKIPFACISCIANHCFTHFDIVLYIGIFELKYARN